MSDRIRTLISEEEVNRRIDEVATQINKDYAGKSLHLVCILKGSVFFTTELSKRLTIPVTMDFMSCSSYGSGTVSKGIVKLNKDLDEPIEGRDVLIIEDIIDSGNTLAYLMKLLSARKPASLSLCTLLDKPSRRVHHEVEVSYTCFTIDDLFVLGCGMDYDQRYRNLPYVGVLERDE
ncbi:MAG: hypoxanthine phosphoribosyltransferase [Lachnospiraceae bacterium]|nr:hypoxanthine phosphoribosyltransferase [Lachnospiraceae bacterium]